jgi:hypothetical protein
VRKIRNSRAITSRCAHIETQVIEVPVSGSLCLVLRDMSPDSKQLQESVPAMSGGLRAARCTARALRPARERPEAPTLTLTTDSDARTIPRALGAIAAFDHTCFSLTVDVSMISGAILRMLILPDFDVALVPGAL